MGKRSAPKQPAPAAPLRHPPPSVAIVVSRYNHSITARLERGAVKEYARRAGPPANLTIIDAPGAYELPAIALAAARTGRFAGIVALGCLIRGETRHDRYIAGAVAHGLVSVAIQTGRPCTFGVLTVNSPAQAKARAGGKKGNKGADAMSALLDAIEVCRALTEGASGAIAPARQTARPDKAATRRTLPAAASQDSSGDHTR